MKLFVIDDIVFIKELTKRDNIKKMILRVDYDKKKARFESDFTLFDLTENLDYIHTVSLLEKKAFNI